MKVYHFFLTVFLVLTSFSLWGQQKTQADVIQQIDLGIEAMGNNEHLTSIEMLFSAKETALQHEWYLQAFNATLNIGTNYYMMLDYGEALQYYLQAYEIAIDQLGPKQKKVVYNNIGVLYIGENDTVKAEEYFLKAYAISKEMDEHEEIGACAVNLALLANQMGKLDLASAYLEEAAPLLKKKKNVILLAKIAKVENLLLQGHLAEAEKLALQTLPQLDNLSIVAHGATVNSKITLLLTLSDIYKEKSDYVLARKYALKAREQQSNIEGRKQIYESLSNLYTTRNDLLPAAMAYKDSMLMASDSLNAIKNGALFESEKVKFQMQDYKHQLVESKKALVEEKAFYTKLIIGVILIMGFLVWLYKNNALKHKQRKKIVELELDKEKNNRLLVEKQRQKKEALALLEKERLKNELERKNRELTAKAMFQASKNELIEDVVHSLSSNTQIATDSRLKTHIHDLKTHLKKDTQWDSFFIHFEELNRGFINRLMAKHPKLTSNDIRFLTFIYMNLSYKEISSLLNITVQSCRKRKERISKKMNVPQNTSLQAYLSAI
ncbi:tetratricopeptide repeat protein [Marixanthomonas spongiae]|uniref:Uncharacterized protein n=1 Tax=Marixanthomonas spongiae TaxID=2174845 RepID=A0A2U0I559_9FLAO|nr:tetratricopeptide repeat protein [Marixanthomonas spongiae]PVW16243.1 hypothetical protein DDV96_02950 [Marixanthomonas spongiae]